MPSLSSDLFVKLGWKIWYGDGTPIYVTDPVFGEYCQSVTGLVTVDSGGQPVAAWPALLAAAPQNGVEFLTVWYDIPYTKRLNSSVEEVRYRRDIYTGAEYYWYDALNNRFGVAARQADIPAGAVSFRGRTLNKEHYVYLGNLAHGEQRPHWL